MPNHVTLIKHFKNSKNISSMRYNTFTIKTNEKEKNTHTHKFETEGNTLNRSFQ